MHYVTIYVTVCVTVWEPIAVQLDAATTKLVTQENSSGRSITCAFCSNGETFKHRIISFVTPKVISQASG